MYKKTCIENTEDNALFSKLSPIWVIFCDGRPVENNSSKFCPLMINNVEYTLILSFWFLWSFQFWACRQCRFQQFSNPETEMIIARHWFCFFNHLCSTMKYVRFIHLSKALSTAKYGPPGLWRNSYHHQATTEPLNEQLQNSMNDPLR